VGPYRSEPTASSIQLPIELAIAKLVGLVLRAYQLVISPLLGANCRFEPSCSRFTEEAIARHGIRRGVPIALRRLSRCHPWGGPGGFDPVP
jgi:hypothetical protein